MSRSFKVTRSTQSDVNRLVGQIEEAHKLLATTRHLHATVDDKQSVETFTQWFLASIVSIGEEMSRLADEVNVAVSAHHDPIKI